MLRGPSARLGGGGCSFPGRGFLLAVAWAGGPWSRVFWGWDSEARGVADRAVSWAGSHGLRVPWFVFGPGGHDPRLAYHGRFP